MKYANYEEFKDNQPVPKKNFSIMETQDIPGAIPTNLKVVKGRKKANFFPYDDRTNEFYNKESLGGGDTGHFRRDGKAIAVMEAMRDKGKRVFPDINPPR